MTHETPLSLHSKSRFRSGSRLIALDVARALAIIGMVAVNVGPQRADDLLGQIFMIPFGRASLLFMLLAGLGLGFLSHPSKLRHWSQTWRTLVWRSMFLLAFGFGLQQINHGVSVILAVYGTLFLISIPLTQLKTRTLSMLTLIAALVLPIAWMATLALRGLTFEGTPILLAFNLLRVLDGIFITGPYPAMIWIIPLLTGLTLSRWDLSQRQVQRSLLSWGLIAMIGGVVVSRALIGITGIDPTGPGFSRLVASYDHSQAPLWLLSGIGSAAGLVGALLLLGPWLQKHAVPLVNLGRLSLTMYVAHLLLIAVFVRPDPHTTAEGIVYAMLISVFCLVCAHVWVVTRGQGPLERFLRAPSALFQRTPSRR